MVAHFNEWMLGMGALYKAFCAKNSHYFTTRHFIGRSIAGNNLPLQISTTTTEIKWQELNMISKHSWKITAHNVDCFTAVSDTTARVHSVA